MRFIIVMISLFLIFSYELSFGETGSDILTHNEKQASTDEKTEGEVTVTPEKNVESKRYALWVGSALDLIKAEWEKGIYAGFGQPVVIVTVDLKEKGKWHRTYVGNFSSKSEAQEFKNKLKESINLQWAEIITLK